MRSKAKKKFSVKDFVLEKKNLPICIIIVAFVALFAFSGITIAKNSADISRLEVKRDEVAAQVAAVEEENAQLNEVLESDDKNAYIEQKAREKGYVKSDETVFYDISAGE
ncbi:MAG: septum formation initiator family protein [Eubacterium sp.]|nr:septum formation initiator family protein [Eubacterium sp.]